MTTNEDEITESIDNLTKDLNELTIEESDNKNTVILKCIKEKNKLRIRFYSFKDFEGNTYTNVYNNSYNCRFPKNIRKEGYYYEIFDSDIKLNKGKTKPFYVVKKNNIKIIKPDLTYKLDSVKIFEINECIICMDAKTNNVFLPCGHMCTCLNCFLKMKKFNNIVKCPMCRRIVDENIEK